MLQPASLQVLVCERYLQDRTPIQEMLVDAHDDANREN